MKRLFFLYLLSAFAQLTGQDHPGFYQSPEFNEQVITFNFSPEIRIHINAPSKEKFNPVKPAALALYALPNGNTIEQTAGKILSEGDDWHFDIQHIAAQTRFLRNDIDDYNLVIAYLEADQKSWPAWKASHPDYKEQVQGAVDYLLSIFNDYNPFIILTGHSGGGRFIFSFLDAVDTIPAYVKRISFLDSNYGYENFYGAKIAHWLKISNENFLTVLAYNDSIALYEGKTFVSPTGGTWYRSRLMRDDLDNYFSFADEEDENFIKHSALDGRVKIILKKNPGKEILHTLQVERNGFIHSILAGTEFEEKNYKYFGDRAYPEYIHYNEIYTGEMHIPPRRANAVSGPAFMQMISDMSFAEREELIYKEISRGNIPNFLRQLVEIESSFKDAEGNSHTVKYKVMTDYLSIGSDEDFCRIPIGPKPAQKIADLFGASLPTKKLVDDIYKNAEVRLEPQFYKPSGNQNEKIEQFVIHNNDIEQQRISVGGGQGELIAGIKKDVVISNKIFDPARPNHVVIYGWHKLDGSPIQPLTNIHINSYVDYSHGVRLIRDKILINKKEYSIEDVLKDPVLFKLLSDEDEPMKEGRYQVY